MPIAENRLIFKNIDRDGYTIDLDCYLKNDGYKMLKKALGIAPADIVTEVKTSGLRGRGGAGFSCGMKWSFIDPKKNTKPVYLICNADESEPGTFKDKQIIYKDPHQLLEGMAISCFANNVHLAYIYIRGEFTLGAKILEQAIAEAKAKNYLGKNILGAGYDLEIYVHRGAGAYICGEETGLIESLEGKRPYPRIKPPYFPAVLGLYMCPTIVNNVETLCAVKHIVDMGGAAYAKLGKPGNTGTRMLCVSGDVEKPGYFEFEVGKITIGELINDVCGGIKGGRKLKALIPGGSSAKVMKAGDRYKIKTKQADGTMLEKEMGLLDLPIDFDTLAAAGSMAGSGGIIVMDETRDMVECLSNISTFYAHESCGQCTPCREGSLWMKKITGRLAAGKGHPEDVKLLVNVADNIAGRTICAFADCALIAREPDMFRQRRWTYQVTEPLIAFYEVVMRPEWSRLESGHAEAVWRDRQADFLSRVVGPHFESLCRSYALQTSSELFGGPSGEVGSGVVTDPVNRTQIEIDVAVLAPREPGRTPRLLSLGEVKWGKVMDHRHVERLARARDLLSGSFDTSDCVLACYSAAGFHDDLRTATDPRLALITLDDVYAR